MKKLNTNAVIEQLIAAMPGENVSAREQHIYRENLRNLVRLAKAEQVMDIKANVKRLASAAEAQNARRYAKAVLLAQRMPNLFDPQFESKHR